ncbi:MULTISPECIES: galactofuranose ABC transporter, permease protein YjfF [unclassified Rhodococcus (in: high G+C Gram-positive bacteria)]|jgi:simple sugar transport system permease protein|uniref:galactofuranose ABC transporter, permease protein YjfF n=1 Tax=unclassified Rhodococcus (in: high G+C Gram-positive bacteria) TaxID=192944 RepID=UPI00254A8A4D|nr:MULTISPECIES: galactofuranose ABC transporter, permease protein YjfF [unclassified Rhodococcus (in: high G+C Gram-positive bacteria)]
MTDLLTRPPATSTAPSRWDRIRRYSPPSRFLPVIATFALLVGLFGVGEMRYPGFADPQLFLSLFVDNAFLIVLAVGMTFVILTGGIDLSVGSVVALSTMIAARTLQLGWSPFLVIAAVLLCGTLLGTTMGVLVHYLQIQPFVATLAGMFLARGLCYMIGVESIPITDETFSSIAFAVIELPGGYTITWSVVIALVTVAVAAYVLACTRFGRSVYGIGGNEASAVLMGLRVAAVKVGVYSISGFCAALGGLLFAFYALSGYSLHAVGMELDAIAAVVIGGTLLTGGRGYVLGSVVGVLILGAIQTFIAFDGTLSSWWTRITVGTLLLVFVVAQRLTTVPRARFRPRRA